MKRPKGKFPPIRILGINRRKGKIEGIMVRLDETDLPVAPGDRPDVVVGGEAAGGPPVLFSKKYRCSVCLKLLWLTISSQRWADEKIPVMCADCAWAFHRKRMREVGN